MGDVISCHRALLAVHDVESDLGFHHGPETIPRTFPMTWATKFDPHHLQSCTVIVRSLRPEVDEAKTERKCGFLSLCFSFIIPGKLERLVKPLVVENIIKLETARNKRLRGPAVMLFVIGDLKKRNPIPLPVPQVLSFYKTDLPIRRADTAHYVYRHLYVLILT